MSSSSKATGCVRSGRTSRKTLGEPRLSPSLSLSLSLSPSPSLSRFLSLSLSTEQCPPWISLCWRGRLVLWQCSSSYRPTRLRGLSANRGDVAVSRTAVRARLGSCIHLGGRTPLLPHGARLGVTSAIRDARYVVEPAWMHLPSPVVGVEQVAVASRAGGRSPGPPLVGPWVTGRCPPAPL